MTHSQLVEKAVEWLRSYRCGVVLSEQACVSGEMPDAIGWKRASHSVMIECKLSRADSVPKLYAQKPYKGLPLFIGDRSGVYAIGCMLVGPPHRRAGLTHALVAGAVSLARARGARAIEAFPREHSGPAHDGDLFRGPLSAYLASGFVEVDRVGPYPVLRLSLA